MSAFLDSVRHLPWFMWVTIGTMLVMGGSAFYLGWTTYRDGVRAIDEAYERKLKELEARHADERAQVAAWKQAVEDRLRESS